MMLRPFTSYITTWRKTYRITVRWRGNKFNFRSHR